MYVFSCLVLPDLARENNIFDDFKISKICQGFQPGLPSAFSLPKSVVSGSSVFQDNSGQCIPLRIWFHCCELVQLPPITSLKFNMVVLWMCRTSSQQWSVSFSPSPLIEHLVSAPTITPGLTWFLPPTITPGLTWFLPPTITPGLTLFLPPTITSGLTWFLPPPPPL